MVDYTYDFHIKSPDAVHFSHWKTDEQGELILEPKPGNLFFRIALGGFLAGIGWIGCVVFFPVEIPIKILLALGGVLFIIGGWFAGNFIENCSKRYGAYLVFQTDGSLRFPRLKKTIIPNETTCVEILPTDLRYHNRKTIGMTDLIILHEDQSYYIITGLNQGVFSPGSIKRVQKEIVEVIQKPCTSEKSHENE